MVFEDRPYSPAELKENLGALAAAADAGDVNAALHRMMVPLGGFGLGEPIGEAFALQAIQAFAKRHPRQAEDPRVVTAIALFTVFNRPDDDAVAHTASNIIRPLLPELLRLAAPETGAVVRMQPISYFAGILAAKAIALGLGAPRDLARTRAVLVPIQARYPDDPAVNLELSILLGVLAKPSNKAAERNAFFAESNMLQQRAADHGHVVAQRFTGRAYLYPDPAEPFFPNIAGEQRLERAEHYLRLAAQQDPVCQYDLALVCEQRGKLDEAERLLRAVSAIDHTAHRKLGQVLERLERPAEAEVAYRAGHAANDIGATHALAAMMDRNGKFSDANALYGIAAAAGSYPAMVVFINYNAGSVRIGVQQDPRAALIYCERLIKADKALTAVQREQVIELLNKLRARTLRVDKGVLRRLTAVDTAVAPIRDDVVVLPEAPAAAVDALLEFIAQKPIVSIAPPVMRQVTEWNAASRNVWVNDPAQGLRRADMPADLQEPARLMRLPDDAGRARNLLLDEAERLGDRLSRDAVLELARLGSAVKALAQDLLPWHLRAAALGSEPDRLVAIVMYCAGRSNVPEDWGAAMKLCRGAPVNDPAIRDQIEAVVGAMLEHTPARLWVPHDDFYVPLTPDHYDLSGIEFVPSAPAQAREWHQANAEMGSVDSAVIAATLFARAGDEAAQADDHGAARGFAQQALVMHERAAELGNLESALAGAAGYEAAMRVAIAEEDEAAIASASQSYLRLHEIAAGLGDVGSMMITATAYQAAAQAEAADGNDAAAGQAYRQAYAMFAQASDRDHASAMLEVAAMQYEGLGTPRDFDAAYRRLAVLDARGDALGSAAQRERAGALIDIVLAQAWTVRQDGKLDKKIRDGLLPDLDFSVPADVPVIAVSETAEGRKLLREARSRSADAAYQMAMGQYTGAYGFEVNSAEAFVRLVALLPEWTQVPPEKAGSPVIPDDAMNVQGIRNFCDALAGAAVMTRQGEALVVTFQEEGDRTSSVTIAPERAEAMRAYQRVAQERRAAAAPVAPSAVVAPDVGAEAAGVVQAATCPEEYRDVLAEVAEAMKWGNGLSPETLEPHRNAFGQLSPRLTAALCDPENHAGSVDNAEKTARALTALYPRNEFAFNALARLYLGRERAPQTTADIIQDFHHCAVALFRATLVPETGWLEHHVEGYQETRALTGRLYEQVSEHLGERKLSGADAEAGSGLFNMLARLELMQDGRGAAQTAAAFLGHSRRLRPDNPATDYLEVAALMCREEFNEAMDKAMGFYRGDAHMSDVMPVIDSLMGDVRRGTGLYRNIDGNGGRLRAVALLATDGAMDHIATPSLARGAQRQLDRLLRRQSADPTMPS